MVLRELALEPARACSTGWWGAWGGGGLAVIATEIRTGDALDFWRVVRAWKPGRRLTLLAEMKLPGIAILEFEVAPHGERARGS